MAGHSKWTNIKHRKARQDQQKGKLFTKISREITVAAREGGGDIDSNFSLRLAVQKAREANMPNENINRAIKRGTGEIKGVDFEQVIYEGYGPAGTAILLEILTDNRNRTASEIRNLFSRNESSLGESGCVSWMFQRKGYLNIAAREEDDEDEIMLMAVDAGAEDFELEDGFYNVITAPEELEIVKDRLSAKGLEISSAEITMLPESTVPIEDKETAAKVLRLIEALEDHDDVKNVYCNCEIPEEFYPE